MSNYTDNWDTDYAKLFGGDATVNGVTTHYYGDLKTSEDEGNDYTQSVQDYHSAMERVGHTSDAMVAFTMLAWLMANQGFNQLNLKSAVDGGDLKIQGDLTKLGNDIESMTNQSDDATLNKDGTYTYSTDSSKNYLHLVALHSEMLYQALSGSTTVDQQLQGAIGSDASGALSSQYLIIRQQIYDTNAGGDNPTTGYVFNAMQPAQTPITPGHPLPGDAYMDSYCEFQNDLSARGDPKGANEAAKVKTDAFNENTSTTQGTNSASQEIMSNDSNIAKAVQALVVDMFHACTDVMSAAIKAVTKG